MFYLRYFHFPCRFQDTAVTLFLSSGSLFCLISLSHTQIFTIDMNIFDSICYSVTKNRIKRYYKTTLFALRSPLNTLSGCKNDDDTKQVGFFRLYYFLSLVQSHCSLQYIVISNLKASSNKPNPSESFIMSEFYFHLRVTSNWYNLLRSSSIQILRLYN